MYSICHDRVLHLRKRLHPMFDLDIHSLLYTTIERSSAWVNLCPTEAQASVPKGETRRASYEKHTWAAVSKDNCSSDRRHVGRTFHSCMAPEVSAAGHRPSTLGLQILTGTVARHFVLLHPSVMNLIASTTKWTRKFPANEVLSWNTKYKTALTDRNRRSSSSS